MKADCRMVGRRDTCAVAREVRRLAPLVSGPGPLAPLLLGIALLLAAAPVGFSPRKACGQPPGDQGAVAPLGEVMAALERRGDLTLNDATLRQALFTISQSWGVNLVVGQDVGGQVNGVFRNAPLKEILHSVLYANGYGYRIVGNGLVVMPLDKLGSYSPLFESATITLRAAKPEDLAAGAQLLASPQGRIEAVPSARSLIVVDLPERVALIRNFARDVDEAALAQAGGAGSDSAQLQVWQYAPQFVKSDSLKEALQSLASKEGKVTTVDAENRLVVIDYPASLALIERAVRQMDVPRPQVRITALIYDISLEDVERLGVNWNHALQGRYDDSGEPQSVFSFDTLLQVPVAATDPSGVMTFMTLSRYFDITAVIDLLSTCKDSRLLADPMVTVVDREPAKIQIITEIPFQQLTQTGQGGNIGTTAFREAGVVLDVTPHIASDGTIQLDVTPSFSRLTGFTSGANPQPIIDKREAQTVVRVANGQTLVIGGLRQRTLITERRGIPYLKDVWGFGKLFSASDTTVRESELVVFLSTELVMPDTPPRGREAAAMYTGRAQLDLIPPAPQGWPWGPCDDCVTPPSVLPREWINGAPQPERLPPAPGTTTSQRYGDWRWSTSTDPRRDVRRLPATPTSSYDNQPRRADLTRLPQGP